MGADFSPAFAGIFSSIISLVLKAILTPIMELVGFLLRTLIGPLLEAVLVPVAEFFVDYSLGIWGGILYTLLKCLLQIIEAIEGTFKIFAGIGTVTYNNVPTNLIDIFLFENTTLTRLFWIITVLCLALSMIFTIYAVARSTLDFDFENKRSVGKVLGSMGRAGITFLMVPLFLMFSLKLSAIVMTQLYNVTRDGGAGGSNMSVADMIFQISAINANRNEDYDLSEIENFTTGEMRPTFNEGGWKDKDRVGEHFFFSKFDYIVGFGVGLFMLFILATISFTFVQRLFEIMLMYVAAPFFVSSMPLDDGQKYGAWRDMFIGKLASGVGTLVLMNLYLLAIPIVMSPVMRLDPRATDASSYLTYDYLMKMIFVIGGALAVKQGGSLITSLVSYQAGTQEQSAMLQSGAMVMGAALMAGGAAKTAGGVAGKAGAYAKKTSKAAYSKFRQSSSKKMTKVSLGGRPAAPPLSQENKTINKPGQSNLDKPAQPPGQADASMTAPSVKQTYIAKPLIDKYLTETRPKVSAYKSKDSGSNEYKGEN